MSLHTELSSRGYQHQVLNMSVRIGKKNEKVNDHYSEMAKQHCVQYQFELQFGGYRLEVSYAHSLQVIPVMDGRRPLLAIRREPDSRSGNNMPFLAPVVSVRIPAIITTNYCSIQ